eukprot:jgi/Astpho2/2166/fgenesh1_pg.00040_%23_22_t
MAEEYSRHLARVVVAQTAESTGFEAVQTSALEVLADLLLCYISQLGSASSGYAQQAGRTDTNVNDLLLACEDMGISLDDLKQYASAEEEVPFAHPLSVYPVSKAPRKVPTFRERKEEPPQHIPDFLPAFPDKHTYMQSAAFPGHEKNARQQRLAAAKAKRQAEKSLVRLHQQAEAATAAVAPRLADKLPAQSGSPRAHALAGASPRHQMLPPSALGPHRAAATGNPFLARPLWEDSSMQPAAVPDDEAPDFDPAAASSQHDSMDIVEEQPDGGAAGNWGGWKADADAFLRQSQSRGPQVPFRLDVAAGIHRKAQLAVLKRNVEDAFAASTDAEVAEDPVAAARRKASRAQKQGGYLRRDPGIERAEQILNAGADAVAMDQQQ